MVDQRDYINGCMTDNRKVIKKLNRAFLDFNDNNYKRGNKRMNNALPFWQDAMVECDETNEYFEHWLNAKETFMQLEDWQSVARDNYSANKAYIDQ